MDIVLNESEKAKQELMHVGMRGMRWGVRKADTRLALAMRNGAKGSRASGAEAVRKATKVKDAKANERYEKFLQSSHDRYKNADKALRQKLKDIDAGPGSRWSKFSDKIRAQGVDQTAYTAKATKGDAKFIQNERDRNTRVKAKQDKFSDTLKAKMEAEIKDVKSKGSVVDKVFGPGKIEGKYLKQLTEGLAKIDEEDN